MIPPLCRLQRINQLCRFLLLQQIRTHQNFRILTFHNGRGDYHRNISGNGSNSSNNKWMYLHREKGFHVEGSGKPWSKRYVRNWKAWICWCAFVHTCIWWHPVLHHSVSVHGVEGRKGHLQSRDHTYTQEIKSIEKTARQTYWHRQRDKV